MAEGQGTTSERIIASTKYRIAQLRSQRWLAGLLAAIIIAGIIVGIVFAIRAIRHSGHHTTNVPTAVNQSPSSNKGTSGSGSSSKSGHGAMIPGTDNNSSKKSSGNQAAGGPSLKSGQQLTNTGPGDVAAIFLGASFAAASLHYLVNLRKQNR